MPNFSARFARNHRAVTGTVPSLEEILAIATVGSVLLLLSLLR